MKSKLWRFLLALDWCDWFSELISRSRHIVQNDRHFETAQRIFPLTNSTELLEEHERKIALK